MPRIRAGAAELTCEPGASLLTVLQEAGLPVTSGCRAGACQSCLVSVLEGSVPSGAQAGLSPALVAQRFVLSCQAQVTGDLVVALTDERPLVEAEVLEVLRPTDDVARLFLRPSAPFPYFAGQFVHLVRADGTFRPYSLASVPEEPHLELHVRRLPGGALSPYLCDDLRPGDKLAVRGPAGNVFYTADRPEQPLLLAGTGTGLAPLKGIARAALRAGHKGPIALWHGAKTAPELYEDRELRTWVATCGGRASYEGWVRDGAGDAGAPAGSTNGASSGDLLAAVTGWARENRGGRLFLCGSPSFVRAAQRAAYLAGMSLQEIRADAFLPSAAG